MKLPASVEKYLKSLIKSYPAISEIWLFGSRANDRAHEGSDWDLMIFANSETLERMKIKGPLPPKDEKVSILIVYDGNNFISPWPREKDGHVESGSLGEWDWGNLTDTQAWYDGTRGRPNGTVETQSERAIKLYPFIDNDSF